MTTATATKVQSFYVYPASGVEKFRYTNKRHAQEFAQMCGGTVVAVYADGTRKYI